MKSITDFINEALLNENESIKSEEDFKKYAKNKFEEAFGDDLDEDKMNETIDGILNDYAEDAENGDWGKLVGVLNKSF
jgi:signal transduction histidine kinase